MKNLKGIKKKYKLLQEDNKTYMVFDNNSRLLYHNSLFNSWPNCQGIYKLLNTQTNESYINYTSNLKRRAIDIVSKIKSNYSYSIYKNLTIDNYSLTILDNCKYISKSNMIELTQLRIEENNSR